MEGQQCETGKGLLSLAGEHIVVRQGYCGGKAHIAGHRIKVQHVAVWHERQGKGPDEIVAEHPGVTLADVHAALTYYYDHRQQIDVDIQADEAFAAGPRTASSPSLLVKRLGYGHNSGDPVSPR
jgi:uncharacterized protein (DUF433 family)